ncbi:MAG: lipocalin family protein [Melioribacteraceae bacterium]|nr:lipocalin family protein [Melioribacteraceae bacterium]
MKNPKNYLRLITFLMLIVIFVTGCSVPEEMKTDHIPSIKNFDVERYMGKWYEIARLPNRFEEGLSNVTATYSLEPDGEIKVLNQGFDDEEGEWSSAEGEAWVKDPAKPAELKVAFFLWFGADYKIIELDTLEYRYSVVTSESKEYLWILCREKKMPEEELNQIVTRLNNLGFDTGNLVYVKQNINSN